MNVLPDDLRHAHLQRGAEVLVRHDREMVWRSNQRQEFLRETVYIVGCEEFHRDEFLLSQFDEVINIGSEYGQTILTRQMSNSTRSCRGRVR